MQRTRLPLLALCLGVCNTAVLMAQTAQEKSDMTHDSLLNVKIDTWESGNAEENEA